MPSTPASQSQNSPRVVSVDLADRAYAIMIGKGLRIQIANLLRERFVEARHAVLVSDTNVRSISGEVRSCLEENGWRVTTITVPSGEATKSVFELSRLWQEMLNDHTDRGSVVVAVGGGVVGDLAGFAAASFARGISLVQVPTTLLSQVDSSVGGKTGINLPGSKNIVGAFWQPSLVVIDTDTLTSLPPREYVSGLAEVAKYGVILLADLFTYLEANFAAVLAKDAAALAHIVSESCKAKALVVQEDERETSGRRAILNYGHTFAHALESVTGYGHLLHGEAVAIGMHMAALLAAQLGRVDESFVARQEALLKQLELPTRFSEADPLSLWDAMQHDKKVQHGRLRFVLPSRLGHVELVPDIHRDDVCRAIERAAAP